jgi:hypothetical protein
LRTLHSTSNAIRHSLDPSHRSHTLQSQSDMETVLENQEAFARPVLKSCGLRPDDFPTSGRAPATASDRPRPGLIEDRL